MQHEQAIFEELEEIFHSIFNDDLITLSATSTAEDIPAWDSLAHINIVLAVEQRFGIQFTSAEMSSFRDLGSLVECLKNKRSGR